MGMRYDLVDHQRPRLDTAAACDDLDVIDLENACNHAVLPKSKSFRAASLAQKLVQRLQH
jgi:hypothetical protein